MRFWERKYSATINLQTANVFAGEEIAGEVIYTAKRDCDLKDVQLTLSCEAIYYHQGRKKHVLNDHPPIGIPLRDRDEETLVNKTKHQLEVNKDTVFKFKERLPFGLPPSMKVEEGNRRILDVSYKLELTSKHTILSIKKIDSSKTLTMLSRLGLDTPPFSETDGIAQEFKDSHFGQGLDMKTKVCLPRFSWQRGDRMEVKVDVTRHRGITNHEVTATLERTIQYKDLKTTTDVARSDTTRMPKVSCKLMQSWKRVHLDPLLVQIPRDTPQSGVMGHPTLSINYRIRVDIKPTSNDLSMFTLGVPLVIGALQEISSRGVSTEDRMRDTESVRNRQLTSHGSQSRLNVENQSSRTTRPSSSNLSSPSQSTLSLESSAPPAMGVRVPGGAAHAPSARGQPSSCTYRKEVASTSPHHSATNWEDTLRRYPAPLDPPLVPQRPISSSHGRHGASSLTEVRHPAGRTMSLVPEQEVLELRNLEGRFSDPDPHHKAARKRRSDETC